MKNPFEDFIDPFNNDNNEAEKSGYIDPFSQPQKPHQIDPFSINNTLKPSDNPFDYWVPDKLNTPEEPRDMSPEEAAFLAEQDILREEISKRDLNDKKNVAGIFDLPELTTGSNIKKSRQALRQTIYDGDIFTDIVQDSPVMEETLNEARKLLRTLPALAQDQFLALFKMEPEMVTIDHMIKEYEVNWHLLKGTMSCQEYINLVPSCTLDIFCSAIGSEVLLRRIVDLLKEKIEEHRKAKEEADKNGMPDPNAQNPCQVNMDEWVKTINDMIDNSQNLNKVNNSISQIDEMIKKADAAKQKGLELTKDGLLMDQQLALKLADQLSKIVNDNMKTHVPEIETIIKTALTDTEPEVGAVRDAVNMWGWAENDGNVRITMENKRRALERLRTSDKMKRLAELIGHFRKIAQAEKKRKSPDGQVNIKTVTQGGNILEALPSELGLLMHPTARADVLRRMNENRLLVYKKESTGFVGRGPMVVCGDTSGSMSGQKEEWSKALALALIEIAQQQKRDFYCIHFSTNIVGEWEVQKGLFDPNVVIDIAEKFSGGGTNFERPLMKAMDVIKKNKYKKADILFITDGDCAVSGKFISDFKALKTEKDFMVRTVLINTGSGGTSRSTVAQFSDSVTAISNLADLNGGDDSVARAILGGIQD